MLLHFRRKMKSESGATGRGRAWDGGRAALGLFGKGPKAGEVALESVCGRLGRSRFSWGESWRGGQFAWLHATRPSGSWDSVAARRHPCPCGGPMYEHRMDAMWLEAWKSTDAESRRSFGAKRRRGFGGVAPQCMKCHYREKAAVWLPFRDSVGIRTQDSQLRRLLLYPTELRNRALPKKGAP